MNLRRPHLAALCAGAALLAAALYLVLRPEAPSVAHYTAVDRAPRIRPDYADSVIPPNVAPLNFQVLDEGTQYHVRIHSARGDAIAVTSDGPGIRIPMRHWKAMLEANRGETVYFDVYARGPDRAWRRFDPVAVKVAEEPIDRYVVYRRINVMYAPYVRMSIRQRDIETYRDTAVLDNTSFDYGCMNCHTFLNNGSHGVVLHIRSGQVEYGTGMLVIRDGAVEKIDARTEFSSRPAGFTSWHPSGRLVAFSINKVRQAFHTARTEVRDGVDLDSDIAVYLLDSHTVSSRPALCDPNRLETFPAWSADGRHLYFCTAPVLWENRDVVSSPRLGEVRYSLMRIGYDVDSGSWGEPETVLSAEETGLSITEPRASPDGRFLVFCMSDYSTFPAFQPSADLYIMDLQTRRYERLDCSSPWSESWHSWSSNSRWLAFSSKRSDGLFLRVWFSYIGPTGKASKPFVLPQEDPAFYDSFIRLFQMPELTRDPVPITGERLARVIRSQPWGKGVLPVTGATPGRSSAMPSAPDSGAAEPWTSP